MAIPKDKKAQAKDRRNKAAVLDWLGFKKSAANMRKSMDVYKRLSKGTSGTKKRKPRKK